MKSFIEKYFYHILITLIVGLLFYINYKSGTYLIGWDSLQTELHPWLGVKRALYAGWIHYQGFGFTAGMADAADLVRALFVALLSYILPNNLVRYTFMFLMVLVGGLGMLRLLIYSGLKEEKRLFAFLGALFYMLNLGTVQIFSVPFEPYAIFFALLPWELWIFIKILDTYRVTEPATSSFTPIREPHSSQHRLHNKKHWFLFILINILATPQAYLQTFFVVYMLLLATISLGFFIQQKKLKVVSLSALLITIIIAINSFWLLPQIYFLKTSGSIVKEAKINQLATDDVFYKNKEKGTINNFVKLEGFYYDLYNSSSHYIFAPWKDHFKNPVARVLPYIMGMIFIIGMFAKSRLRVIFIACFLLITVALLNSTLLFEQINDLLRKSEFINQIFRSPFTKFIIPYSLVASYFFAFGLETISNKIKKVKIFENNLLIKSLLLIITLGIICWYALPSFTGHFISDNMKVSIPQEYFKTFEFFKHVDKNKRIALLPEHTFWGWFFYRWGYDGSGFLWWGIEQPIVSRTFDVWSDKSESYYWELETALNSRDVNKFEKVLEKYDIDYLLMDYSQLPVSSTIKGMQYEQLDFLLQKSKKVSLVKRYNQIAIYTVHHEKAIKAFISIAHNLPKAGPVVKLTSDDKAFQELGDYIATDVNPYAFYPFLDVIAQTHLNNPQWKLTESQKIFSLSRTIPFNTVGYTISPISTTQSLDLYTFNQLHTYSLRSKTAIQKNTITAQFNKDLIIKFNPQNTFLINCGNKDGATTLVNDNSSVVIRASDRAVGCLGYDLPFAEQKYSYLLRLDTENIQGRPLFFYILNGTTQQTHVEDRIKESPQYYIVNNNYAYGLSYFFNFRNESYQNIPSINKINNLDLYLYPADVIKNIKLTQKNISLQKPSYREDFTAENKHNFVYELSMAPGNYTNASVILNQSFHSGWKAYTVDNKNTFSTYFPFIFGKELKEHVVINNWANGWRLNNNATIVIIYWPQYIQYFGYFLALLASIIIVIRIKKQTL